MRGDENRYSKTHDRMHPDTLHNSMGVRGQPNEGIYDYDLS